jgi:hypothetical protein
MKNVAPELQPEPQASASASEPHLITRVLRQWRRILLYGLPFLLFVAVILPCLPSGKAREMACKNACLNYIRQIDGAKEQWALEHHASPGTSVAPADLAGLIKGGWPSCPGGGTYLAGTIGEDAKCSLGHGETK